MNERSGANITATATKQLKKKDLYDMKSPLIASSV